MQHSFRDGENGAPPRVCVAGRTGSLESFALQQRELTRRVSVPAVSSSRGLTSAQTTRDVIHKLRKHSADEHRPSLPAEETQKLSAALVAATAAIRNHVHPVCSRPLLACGVVTTYASFHLSGLNVFRPPAMVALFRGPESGRASSR